MKQPKTLYNVVWVTPETVQTLLTADPTQAWSKVYDVQTEWEREFPRLNWNFNSETGFKDSKGNYRVGVVKLEKVSL